MSNSSSEVLPSITDRSSIDLMNPTQSVPSQHHHHHHYNHHSDSSRSSSSFGSSSHSPTMTLTSPTAGHRTASSTALNDIDPILAQEVEYELGLTKRNGTVTSGTRKNAWGNLSYAELISKAICTSAEQRLTLSEIYDWMIKYVPFFRNKVDRASSAGWKNSIRHNLSLHNRFKRIQSEGAGKSSWWIINPDEKSNPTSSISSHSSGGKYGTKQGRRNGTQNSKASTQSASNPTKRLRTARSTKTTRSNTSPSISNSRLQTINAMSEQISPIEISSGSLYETHLWTNQMESDNSVNNVYEADFYAGSINTPLTNSNGNSTGGIHSNYSFDDGMNNYSSSTNGNSSDYSYHPYSHASYQLPHHPHHPHHHSHHSTSNAPYSINSNSNNYYSPSQSILTDRTSHECHLPLENYSTNNVLAYGLAGQDQGSQVLLDSTDDPQGFLRAQSRSSQSSTSLSPPISTSTSTSTIHASGTTSNLHLHSQKNSSLSTGYHHLNSNGTLTLYGHHHQYHHHSNIENVLHLTREDDDQDRDDDDLSTLVHHHEGIIEDYSSSPFPPVFPSHPHHQFRNSHHQASASILRTVLQRSMIDVHNQ